MVSPSPTRRTFLERTSRKAAVFSGGLGFLSQLPLVTASDGAKRLELIKFDQEAEPLVKLIEDSPREKLLEAVAQRIRQGVSYRQILGALLLAGIRNVQPRPSVGFKFHCVLVVNSCHLASLSGPDQDRWLPIFWALDYFKSSQENEAENSGWRMKAVNDSNVPDPSKAKALFLEAMDSWDVEKADTATSGIVRSLGATEVFNLFARYAARDYRSIGHKAIYLANSWRALQVMGWQYAEPVMRSLAFALLNHRGEGNPSTHDHQVDRPWRENSPKADQIPATWLGGVADDGVPPRLWESFREGTPEAASNVALDALKKGVAPQSLWDGVFLGAGELLMRQPGIIGLHGLTTANAMHYLFRHVANDQLRRQLLLQACSFNPMFRDSAIARGKLGKVTLDALRPRESQLSQEDKLAEILNQLSTDKTKAAESVYGFLLAGGNANQLVHAQRRVLFQKGRDAHDYKFTSAVLEDYRNVSPIWRSRFMATSVFNLKGTGHPDNVLVQRIRTALS